MSLEIQRFTDADCKEWDEFVNQHPEGKFSQLIGYRDVIEKTYGYEASYWLLKKPQGKIAAIFPSFVKRGRFLGDKLLSQPFCEYGGLLGERLDEEDCLFVKSKFNELLTQYKLPFLEVHGSTGLLPENNKIIFIEKPLHQYAILELSSSTEVWENKMDRMVRKAVRKAQRSGLQCRSETTPKNIAEDFYSLYLHSMKKFGTPPHPLSFFLNCLRYLPNYIRLFLVKDEQRTIAALLGFTTGKRVQIISTASDERYLDKRPNDLAHWEFIKWAADSGYSHFDFGPVRYEGQRRFKEKWGVTLLDYSYFFLCSRKNSIGEGLTYSKKAELLASAWRRLVPLPLTKAIGPWFRRQLGD